MHKELTSNSHYRSNARPFVCFVCSPPSFRKVWLVAVKCEAFQALHGICLASQDNCNGAPRDDHVWLYAIVLGITICFSSPHRLNRYQSHRLNKTRPKIERREPEYFRFLVQSAFRLLRAEPKSRLHIFSWSFAACIGTAPAPAPAPAPAGKCQGGAGG